MTNQPLKIGIIGGSLGGLFAGIALNASGHDVHIFEKTTEKLKDRGAGIVLQHELMDFLTGYKIASVEEISVPIHQRRYIDKNGKTVHSDNTLQEMTAWGTIYHKLSNFFPAARYHYGCKLTSFNQQKNKVNAVFENGRSDSFDLLIGADGTNSSVRRMLFPEVRHEYAGYLGWRGVLNEDELAPDVLREFTGHFTFYNMPNSHILCYLIPGNNDEITPGKRRLNWVWYWNVSPGDEVKALLTDVNNRYRPGFVPEGFVKPHFITKQKNIAEQVMPPIFKKLVLSTKQPFIQPINDLSVTRMYKDNICLIGDAAFTPRPHTAASTAKAVSNAIKLTTAINHFGNVREALSMWEKSELQLGNYLRMLGIRLGNNSQFNNNTISV